MAIFEYRGLTAAGKNVKGVVDADNARTARTKLKKDGVFVIEIQDKKKTANNISKKNKTSTKKVGVKELSLMTRQLATLLKANIPLVDSLAGVAEQVEDVGLSEAITDCKNAVNEGSTFHKALSRYPEMFNTTYISMCEAGESSGTLDVILIRLAEFTEAQSELREKVKSALSYPIIMMVASLGILLFIFTFLIPKMVVVFESNPQIQMPWYTTAIIDISNLLVNYWYLFLGFSVIVYFAFINWKNTPAGKEKWDAIALSLPLFGEVNRMVAVARFTRTLATLLNGGVPMLTAMQIVRNVVDNSLLAKAVDVARNNISEGESISGPLKKSGQFPPLVIHMINIGEKTGELENMLIQVADAYDFQVKNKVDGLTSLMGPIVTILMGAVIGIIVLAVMVPMMDFANIQ